MLTVCVCVFLHFPRLPLPLPPLPLPLPPLHLPLLSLPPCLHTFPQTLTKQLSQDSWVNPEFVAPLLQVSASLLKQPRGSPEEAPVFNLSSWTRYVNRVTTVPRSQTGWRDSGHPSMRLRNNDRAAWAG